MVFMPYPVVAGCKIKGAQTPVEWAAAMSL